MTTDLHQLDRPNELRDRAYKRCEELGVRAEFRPLVWSETLRYVTESQWTSRIAEMRRTHWHFFHQRSS
jgi:hypothetical protein